MNTEPMSYDLDYRPEPRLDLFDARAFQARTDDVGPCLSVCLSGVILILRPLTRSLLAYVEGPGAPDGTFHVAWPADTMSTAHYRIRMMPDHRKGDWMLSVYPNVRGGRVLVLWDALTEEHLTMAFLTADQEAALAAYEGRYDAEYQQRVADALEVVMLVNGPRST